MATSTSGPIYAKIIGNNFGDYPYRVGLNTLAYNEETFDAGPECGPGGLHYCELKDILAWIGYGGQLCIVEPVGQIVAVGNKFKTDRMVITMTMPLKKVGTWEFLVDHGVDIQANDNAALLWAAKRGYFEVVKFLVDHGANVHSRNYTALRSSMDKCHREITNYLIKCMADGPPNNILRRAAKAERNDIVRLLLGWSLGDISDRQNYIDYLLLRASLYGGSTDTIKFLVENGADVHVNNDYALFEAIRHENSELIVFLAKHGADVERASGKHQPIP